jgi:site-specific DNA recombinase
MKHLIYARKSSESEERQEYSVQDQLSVLASITEREGYDIGETYEEQMSAKTPGRPVFGRMIRQIEKGKGYSLLVWNIDRLARNMVDGGMILHLMDQGKILEIRTRERTYKNTPDDKFMMGLFFGMAKKYSDDLSVNVKRGLTEKVKRGEWPNKAPFGYLNDIGRKNVTIDPDRSRYVQRVYELYLTGSHGFNSIADILYEQGLRTASGKKVLKSYVQRILSTRFYTGVMEVSGVLYKGNHKPLITKQMYDDAQALMTGSRSRPKSESHFFPLRGFISCAFCGCTYTASLKKGHHYYYCTNGKGICEAHKAYLRENKLYGKIGDVLASLAFTERKIELTYKAAQWEMEHKGGEALRLITNLERQLQAFPARESRLLDTYVDEQISHELYQQKVAILKHERIELELQFTKLQKEQPVFTLEPVKAIFLEGSRATSEFLEAKNEKKHSILENLLWNLSIENGEVAQVQYKTPFHILAKAPKDGSISTMLGD